MTPGKRSVVMRRSSHQCAARNVTCANTCPVPRVVRHAVFVGFVCAMLLSMYCASEENTSAKTLLMMTGPECYVNTYQMGRFQFTDNDGQRILHNPLGSSCLLAFDARALVDVPVLEDVAKSKGIRDFRYAADARRLFFSTDADHLNQSTSNGLRWKENLYSWTMGPETPAIVVPDVGYTFGMDGSDNGQMLVYSSMTDPGVLAADIWCITLEEHSRMISKRQVTEGPEHEMCPFIHSSGKGIVFFRAKRFTNYSPMSWPSWRRWRVYSKDFATMTERELSEETNDYLYWPSVSRDGRWFFYATNNNEISNLKFNDMEKSLFNVEWPELRKIFPKVGDNMFHSAYELLDPQFTYDSKGFVIAIREDMLMERPEMKTNFTVVRLDLETGAVRKLATLPDVTNCVICSADETELFVSDRQVRTHESPKGFRRVRIERTE